jgi:hypothetical protein
MFRKSIFILFLLALALTSFQGSLAAPSADPIFSDDFESGNLSAWTARKTDFGDLAVTAPAALEGTRGMRARLDDNTPIYVTDDTPNGEVSYKAKFLFDPNSIGMANRDFQTIFLGKKGPCGSCVPMLRIEFRRFNDTYMLRAGTRQDDMLWLNTLWFTISDQSHEVEVEWDASQSAGMNNGQLMFFIDSVQKANRTGIDNDTFKVDRVLLGAINGIDTTTRGTTFFDFFESFR